MNPLGTGQEEDPAEGNPGVGNLAGPVGNLEDPEEDPEDPEEDPEDPEEDREDPEEDPEVGNPVLGKLEVLEVGNPENLEDPGAERKVPGRTGLVVRRARPGEEEAGRVDPGRTEFGRLRAAVVPDPGRTGWGEARTGPGFHQGRTGPGSCPAQIALGRKSLVQTDLVLDQTDPGLHWDQTDRRPVQTVPGQLLVQTVPGQHLVQTCPGHRHRPDRTGCREDSSWDPEDLQDLLRRHHLLPHLRRLLQ